MDDSIKDFLRAEGANAESSGFFTLSSDQARKQLKSFALRDPAQFPVLLLAAAVEAQATYFRVKTSRGRLEIAFDGQGWTRTQLETLFSHLLPGQQSPLRYLATAIQAAAQLSTRVEFHTPECTLIVTQDQLHLSPPVGASHFRVDVVGRIPQVAKALQVCRFAPLRITVNEESLNQTRGFSAWVQRRLLRPGQPIDPQPSLQQAPSPGPYWGSLGVPVEEANAAIHLVVHGVAHRVKRGCFAGTIYADHLKLDLSLGQLVEDDAYCELLDQVERHCHLMVLDKAQDPLSLDSHCRAGLRVALEDGLTYWRSRRDASALESLSLWLDTLRISINENSWSQSYQSWQQLRSQGQMREAACLRLQLGETLRNNIGGAVHPGGRPRTVTQAAVLLLRLIPQAHPQLPWLVYWGSALQGFPTNVEGASPGSLELSLLARLAGRPNDGLTYQLGALKEQPGALNYSRTAEICLALGRVPEALDYATQALNLARVRGDDWEQLDYTDLVADCLEISCKPEQALELRVAAWDLEARQTPPNQRLLAYRTQEIAQLSRAGSSLRQWMRWRMRASRINAGLEVSDPLSPLARALLERNEEKALQSLTQLRTDLAPDHESRIFYEMRCAHLLRLVGRAREADLQSARLEVLLLFQQAAEEFMGDTEGEAMLYPGHAPVDPDEQTVAQSPQSFNKVYAPFIASRCVTTAPRLLW